MMSGRMRWNPLPPPPLPPQLPGQQEESAGSVGCRSVGARRSRWGRFVRAASVGTPIVWQIGEGVFETAGTEPPVAPAHRASVSTMPVLANSARTASGQRWRRCHCGSVANERIPDSCESSAS